MANWCPPTLTDSRLADHDGISRRFEFNAGRKFKTRYLKLESRAAGFNHAQKVSQGLTPSLLPESFLQNALSEVNFPAPGGCT